MSLLKEVIKEMAATGSTSAHAIGTFKGSLFGGGLVDVEAAKKRQKMVMRKIGYIPVNEGVTGETDFDSSDVISKLDAAEKKAKTDNDTVAFGLEDENGNVIKIHVRAEQADDFEATLSSLLAGEDENEDDQNSALEIAEVLFKMKDKFEIVDVDWGEIPEDEEQEQEVEPEGEGEGEGEDMEMDAEAGAEDDLEGDLEADAEMDDAEAATSALQQVIDMMKADAEAKKAEADARAAEARAQEAKYTAEITAQKVKQEEEILDMEAYYDDKKKQEQETKRIAQLARFKHDKAREAEDMLSSPVQTEQEEASRENDQELRGEQSSEEDCEMTEDELAALIFRHLQSQN